MDFNQLVKARYSCRSYLDKAIDSEVIIDLFNTIRLAPSAVNLQPWEFVVVTEPDLLSKLYDSYKRDWIKTAPLIIIALGNNEKAWVRSDGKNHVDVDLSIIIDHLTLAATEKGLATCWVCNFNVQKVMSDFNIPSNFEPIALIPLGYAKGENTSSKKRIEITDFLHFNRLK